MDGDHDSDFIGWTEAQARLLLAVPAGTLGLDTENLAEEIADLGRSEIRAASRAPCVHSHAQRTL